MFGINRIFYNVNHPEWLNMLPLFCINRIFYNVNENDNNQIFSVFLVLIEYFIM